MWDFSTPLIGWARVNTRIIITGTASHSFFVDRTLKNIVHCEHFYFPNERENDKQIIEIIEKYWNKNEVYLYHWRSSAQTQLLNQIVHIYSVENELGMYIFFTILLWISPYQNIRINLGYTFLKIIPMNATHTYSVFTSYIIIIINI